MVTPDPTENLPPPTASIFPVILAVPGLVAVKDITPADGFVMPPPMFRVGEPDGLLTKLTVAVLIVAAPVMSRRDVPAVRV